ncbi:glycosyltransferase family 4 protein [Oryzomonas sagensis]|uniref:Glycosyltransferase family 4 protein n=1 Tax=Oryzomonas sagensis TaxID=2603857 RepID=A0ABQ6TRI7_9BACT|nr:glycosyltransferase family 4 protein [Oryzomonas sagensis]KAB0671384.1 glycosyltransferase family 4 protein [Oryzomonas sagensis]
MHILVVTQYFWPENFRINDLVSGLIGRGHRVTVLTGIPNYPEGKYYDGYGPFQKHEQEYAGARVVRVPILSRGKGRGFRLTLNYLSFVISACLLGPLRCRNNYDLIFVFGLSPITLVLPALFFKKIHKIPLMLWVQDLWPESLIAAGAVSSPAVIGMVGRLVKLIYNRCDRILITSRAFVSSIIQYVNDNGQICYLPQYAEDVYHVVNPFDNTPERLLIPEGFVVMFAGNIGAAQDFETIISAAAQLREYKDIHFVVLGDGRMRQWVEGEISRLQLSDTFHLLGRYPLESMPYFFSLADAMLVTLKKNPIFSLTIPAKIQSYLACGRPIIAALDGEGARIIEEAAAGYTCTTEDPTALAATILQTRNTLDDQRRLAGENGLKYYRTHFDRNMLIDRLELWMKQLVAENKKKSADL